MHCFFALHRMALFLRAAVEAGDDAKVKRLLAAGVYLGAIDKNGWTPLHEASQNGYTRCAAALIAAGADVNARDDTGGTPLHGACSYNLLETADVLIEAGANVNAKTNSGWAPIHWACRTDRTDMATKLIRAGADVQAKTVNGTTPLHLLSKSAFNSEECTKVLISAGASRTALNVYGEIPADLTIDPKMLALLTPPVKAVV